MHSLTATRSMYSSFRVCALGRTSRSTPSRMSLSGGRGVSRRVIAAAVRGPDCSRRPMSAATRTPSISWPPSVRPSGNSGRSGRFERDLQLPGDASRSACASSRVCGGKKRDVHVEPSLALQVDLEQVGTRRGEHPDDPAAVARVGHFLGEHRVDAARQAAVAVRAFALAGRLVGFVDEHDDLAERAQHGEDLLEVRFGRARPSGRGSS